MNVYLAGLIGAGKTTIGRLLAAELGWQFADLDDEMQKDAGKDFRQVVEEEGWLGFRQREYRILTSRRCCLPCAAPSVESVQRLEDLPIGTTIN